MFVIVQCLPCKAKSIACFTLSDVLSMALYVKTVFPFFAIWIELSVVVVVQPHIDTRDTSDSADIIVLIIFIILLSFFIYYIVLVELKL